MKRLHALLMAAIVILGCLIRQTFTGFANLSSSALLTPPSSLAQQQELNDDEVSVEVSESQDASKPTNALSETDSVVFVSTLDGTLNAVSKRTGRIFWTLKEDPVLKTPINIDKSPMFLTNPRDGSLYMYSVGFENLKKLPFTIPDLVTASPCRSSDGILYTGYKKDTWFVIDPESGKKIQTLDMDGLQHDICPSSGASSILIGRTEYSLVMFDSATREIRWNATFMDYSSHAMDKDDDGMPDYDLRHFASSSGGSVVTMDDTDGNVVWTQDYRSPVVAMYTFDDSRSLRKIPFVSVAGETLEHLTGRVTSTEWREKFLEHGNNMGRKRGSSFYPTLYIGERDMCFYALPSLVDSSTVTVVERNFRPLLIEGPAGSVPVPAASTAGSAGGYLLLGYHEEPDVLDVNVGGIGVARQIADKSGGVNRVMTLPVPVDKSSDDSDLMFIPGKSNIIRNSSESLVNNSHLNPELSSSLLYASSAVCGLLLLIGIIFSMRWRKSAAAVVHHPEIAQDGKCIIGAITYDPNDVIGHGCAGTFVYRGKFDGRDVAVKRLLPRCFTIADREVALLRESDQHPNVIRYFVTERDSQFCYIALELCSATLQEYVEERSGRGDALNSDVNGVRLLQEAMSGLAHLHSLNIVHRDIKPSNVLLSRPDSRGLVRAMISDFGLCKKLPVGRQSLSKRSGATGTDGWIAPEMMVAETRTTCAVDVFSAGCLVYYVITDGLHPYGDALTRQANIMAARRDLTALDVAFHRHTTALDLLTLMLDCDPSRRPSASSVVQHPFFWSSERILSFFEAVSDKLEKLKEDDLYVLRLESGGLKVVRTDWMAKVTEALRADLRKFRSYNRHSVRDLLRAIRNKKHHFRELADKLKEELGGTVDEFVGYFTSRFPSLLVHTYDAMNICADESPFDQFY